MDGPSTTGGQGSAPTTPRSINAVVPGYRQIWIPELSLTQDPSSYTLSGAHCIMAILDCNLPAACGTVAAEYRANCTGLPDSMRCDERTDIGTELALVGSGAGVVVCPRDYACDVALGPLRS